MGQHNKLHEKMKITLLAQLHIGLWKTTPPPDRRTSSRTWCICLNWQDRNAKPGKYRQVTLSEKLPYTYARATAVALGKRCNLLVLRRMDDDDFAVIGVPKERTNAIDAARDKKNLRELRKAKKIMAPTWVF